MLYQMSYSRNYGGMRGNRIPAAGVFNPALYRLSYHAIYAIKNPSRFPGRG
jgi:hypothetical protein